MKERQIAIQVGAVSFQDEGVDQVLDNVSQMGCVDTLFLANFTYTRGTGGRVLRGQPFPDHGRQVYDTDFVGGSYSRNDPQFYRGTFIRPEDFRAREHDDWDMLAAVLPEARRRDMTCYAWIEESSGLAQAARIPNYGLVLEEDALGRKARRPCFNNPDYRNWHLGLVEDVIKTHGVDGIAWASERQGPLGNLMLVDGPWASESQATCFCGHCRARAREVGIDVERARDGYRALKAFMQEARAGRRPRDGYFVTFWRLLVQYPEILAWERHWHDGQKNFYKDVYGLAKAIRPQVQVGWHIFHMNAFSPFYRATQDMAEMSQYSDFIKLVAYNCCAGPRFADYMHHLHSTIFRDAAPDQTLPFMHAMLGVEEGGLDEVVADGWSADFVGRETRRARRAIEETGQTTRILTGIDIDIPIADEARRFVGKDGLKRTGPEDVHASVTAALEAGADGLVLSRKYSEMQLDNLKAAGQAVRDFDAGARKPAAMAS